MQLQRATKEAKSLLGYTPSGGIESGDKKEGDERGSRREEMRLKYVDYVILISINNNF